MPMVPEVASILYGCLKVGAIAVPIFSGFGVDATATRIDDAECSVLFTGDGFYRRGSEVRLKESADEAIKQAGEELGTTRSTHCRLYRSVSRTTPTRPSAGRAATSGGTKRWRRPTRVRDQRLPSDAESMLLYSSGTTGKPKGIVHTHAGVQMQTAKEIHFGFDQKPEDRFFWVSDIGWMMGPWTLIGNHTFAGTIFMYEGAPDYPNPDRFWEMIERHRITTFGISPTAIRALRKYGDEEVEKHDLSSLRLLGSTGEPWDPESWQWFYEHVGGGDAPIINISGGTEICGCFLMPMPTQPLKPCSLGGPGLGMDIDIVDSDGESIADSHERGFLVARDSCPSMTKSLWEGDDRYLDTYWSSWDDLWDHGDWAQKDEDGFWFLHGRADDALNVAGRKVGPAEVEGAAIEHDAVNQAAAVGGRTTPPALPSSSTPCWNPATNPMTTSGTISAPLSARNLASRSGPAKCCSSMSPQDPERQDHPPSNCWRLPRRGLGDMSSIENPTALDEVREAS